MMSENAKADTIKKFDFKIGIIISALLAVIGIACWIVQLTKGLQLTNLDNFNTWGLYIVGFVLFTGVGAGSLLFASSAWLFESFRDFRPYTRIAAFVGAIGSVVAAGLFIIVDIGNPGRAWYLFTRMNFTSPIVWDALILICYVAIGIILTRQLMQVHQGSKSEKSIRPIAVIAFIAGLMVTITSFAFALHVARPLWNNPSQPISFLLAAVVVGLCMLILVLAALKKTGYMAVDDSVLSKMGKIAAVFLAGECLLILSKVAIGLYSKVGESYDIVHWMVAGDGAVFFYLQVIAVIAGIVLLAAGKKNLLIAGSAVGFFAILMIKYNLLQSQLLNPLISYAGPPGYSGGEGVYLPSLIELGVFIGIVGLGSLLVLLGLQRLNLGSAAEDKAVATEKGTEETEKKKSSTLPQTRPPASAQTGKI